MPFKDHVLTYRNENPDLFDGSMYNARIIAEKLYDIGVLTKRNVVIELAEHALQLDRRDYDLDWVDRQQHTERAPKPRTKDIVSTVLDNFTSRTVMRDGRELREWTWGEFRAEYRLFAAAIAKGRNRPDDELIGTTID